MPNQKSDPQSITSTDRRSVIKSGAMLGVVGATTGLAGCIGGGDDDERPEPRELPDEMPRGGTFNVGGDQDLETMVPFQGFQADYIVTEAMYDRLTTVDEEFDVQPNLAEDWEVNDDATVWTFYLTEDATFANLDGERVTASDVVATYEYLVSDDFAGGTTSIDGVESMDAVDETTVEVTLANSDLDFATRINDPGEPFYVVPETVLEDDPSRLEETDYGSGPFTLVEWEQGNFIRFEAKDDYHRNGPDGTPLPYVDEYVWEVYTDGIQRTNALADGDLDAIHRLESNLIDNIGSDDVLRERTMGEQLPIVLDVEIEPLDDVRVRQAIKHALDRSEFDATLNIETSYGLHSGVPPTADHFNEDLSVDEPFGITAQPDEARDLLDEAGYPDGFEIRTFYYDDGFEEKETIAQLFQQQMSEVGIEFDIERLTQEEWLANYWNQDGEWYVTNYSTRVLGMTVPALTSHSNAPWHETNWVNEEYDEAYEAAVNATDEETYVENIKRMQEINHLEGAWLGTIHPNWPTAHKVHVLNYEPYPTLSVDFLSDCALDL